MAKFTVKADDETFECEKYRAVERPGEVEVILNPQLDHKATLLRVTERPRQGTDPKHYSSLQITNEEGEVVFHAGADRLKGQLKSDEAPKEQSIEEELAPEAESTEAPKKRKGKS